MSTYDPLMKRLNEDRLPVIDLSFAEIETVLGRKLPRSAYDDRIKRQWWANTDSHAQARAWLRAGRKAKLDASRNRVTFIQKTSATDRHTVLDESALSPAARQRLDDVARKHGSDLAATAARLINEATRVRRQAILVKMDTIRERSVYSETSSVELIREGRDEGL